MIEKETSGMNFQDVLELIVRKRLLFFVPLAVTFVLSIAAGFLLPKTYETSALVRIGSPQIVEPLVDQIAVSPNLQEEIESLSREITSWPKLEQLVTQLGLTKDARSPRERESYINRLKERIAIRVRNRNVIEIVYQDRDPVNAQQVVNTLTQNLIDENTRSKKEGARNAIDFIGEQLAIYRQKLAESEQNFTINKLESDLRSALNRRTLIKERLASLQRTVSSQVTTEQNPVVTQLRTYLGALETELTRLSRDAKEGNPRVAELKGEIENVKQRIASEVEQGTVRESISTFNPLYLQTEQELRQVEMEISYLERRKKTLEKDGTAVVQAVSDEELANLERSKRVDEDIYQMLLRQMESAYVSERLQESGKGERFSVVEYARLPLSPVKPKMGKVAAMGLLLGMGLGFGLVFLTETVGKSFQTTEQAKEHLDVQHLGSISRIILAPDGKKSAMAEIREKIGGLFQKSQALSKMKFVSPHTARKVLDSGISPQVVMHHEPKSRVAEEFRVVRTSLCHGLELAKPLQVIVVTSSIRGEGKSTTSSNLAVALADSGKRTLLVDADLRRGLIHEMFALPMDPGMSDVLSSNAIVSAAVTGTPLKNLSILPGGKRPDKPSELFDSPRMAEVMQGLRSQFDAIVLDAPPVLHLPDPCILSKHADGVVMVIESGRTKRQDVASARAILKQVNAPVVGFILTNVQYYMPRYLYDYYYE